MESKGYSNSLECSTG